MRDLAAEICKYLSVRREFHIPKAGLVAEFSILVEVVFGDREPC